jgi:hypothetical protein
MPREPEDRDEHALVVKALCSGLSNCVEWDETKANIVRNNSDLEGIRPQFIRKELIRYVKANGGSVVEQRPETRDIWKLNYKYFYAVILPVAGFKHGLFVEMILTDDDLEFPAVTLVGSHPQRK